MENNAQLSFFQENNFDYDSYDQMVKCYDFLTERYESKKCPAEKLAIVIIQFQVSKRIQELKSKTIIQ